MANYWTQATEDAIITYNQTLDEKLYEEVIYPALCSLVWGVACSLVNSLQANARTPEVLADAVSHLTVNLHKFDPTKKNKFGKACKSFSYFGTAAKFYLMGTSQQIEKKQTKTLTLDDKPVHLVEHIINHTRLHQEDNKEENDYLTEQLMARFNEFYDWSKETPVTPGNKKILIILDKCRALLNGTVEWHYKKTSGPKPYNTTDIVVKRPDNKGNISVRRSLGIVNINHIRPGLNKLIRQWQAAQMTPTLTHD